MIKYTAKIDPDASLYELGVMWKQGHHERVINRLKRDHPGLTAMLLVQLGPLCDGMLNKSDCNMIANHLIDDRMERCQ